MRQAQLSDGTVLEFPDETPDDVMDNTVRSHLSSPSGFSSEMGNATPGVPINDAGTEFAQPQPLTQRATPTAFESGKEAFQNVVGEQVGLDPENQQAVHDAIGMFAPLVGGPAALLEMMGGGIDAGAAGLARGISNIRGTNQGDQRPERDAVLLGQIAALLSAGVASPRALAGRAAPVKVKPVKVKEPGIVKRAIEPLTAEGAENQAGKVLRDAATAPDASIATLLDYRSPVPGVRPTLAEAAGDTGLAAFQRQGIETGPGGAVISEQVSGNIRAREQFLRTLEGAGQDATTIDGAALSRLDNFRAASSEIVSQAQKKVLASEKALSNQADRFASAIGKARSPDVVGDDIRANLIKLYDDYKGGVRDAYNEPALKAVTPVKIPDNFYKKIIQKADNFYGDAGGFVPQDVSVLIGELAQEGQNTRSLMNLDMRLADVAGRYYMRGEFKQSAFIKSIRRSFGEQMTRLLPKEQRAALKIARALRSRQAEIFEEGQLGTVLGRNQFGRYDLGSSRVADTLFAGKNSVESAKQLKTAMGDAGAEEAIRAWASDVFSSAINQQGKFDLKTFNRLRGKYGDVLDKFPAVKRDFANMDSAHRVIEGRLGAQQSLADRLAARQTQTIAAFEKSTLGSFLQGKDADQAMAQILRSSSRNRKLAQLAQQVKGIPEAERGMKTAVIDYIRSRANTGAVDFQGTPLPSQKRLADTLKELTPSLKSSGVFSGPQIRVMEAITKDIDRLTAAQTAALPRNSTTAANLASRGKITEGAFKLLQNAPGTRGVFGGGLRAYDALRKIMTQDEVEAALIKAAQDPAFASRLMSKSTDAAKAAKIRAEIQRDMRTGRISLVDINKAVVGGRSLAEQPLPSVGGVNRAAAGEDLEGDLRDFLARQEENQEIPE